MKVIKILAGISLSVVSVAIFFIAYDHPVLIEFANTNWLLDFVIVLIIALFAIALFGFGFKWIYDALPTKYKFLPNALLRIIGGIFFIIVGIKDLRHNDNAWPMIIFGIAVLALGILFFSMILKRAKVQS